MNMPPPGVKTLKVQVEPGEPTIVRYEHGGHQYVLTIASAITGVWPTGKKDAKGNDEFSIGVQPSISITRDGVPL